MALYLSRYEKSPGYLERVAGAFQGITAGAQAAIIGGAPSPYAMAALGLGVGRRIRPGEQRSLEVARENLEKYCELEAIVAELA